MANLMRRRAAKVERGGGSTGRAESCVCNDDTVGLGRSTRELRVAEQTTAELTDPYIEIPVGGPRVGSASGGKFDRITGRE